MRLSREISRDVSEVIQTLMDIRKRKKKNSLGFWSMWLNVNFFYFHGK